MDFTVRFNLVSKSTPVHIGPGYYDSQATFGCDKQMKAPFGRKDDIKLYRFDDSIPPVGKYESSKPKSNIVISSPFKSKSTRFVYKSQKTPSPTMYNQLENWIPMTNKPHSIRPPIRHKTKSNTAGHEIIGYKDGPNGSLIPIFKKEKGGDWIGPGSYNIGDMKDSEKRSAYRQPFLFVSKS